jgi:hypothetical protein
VGGKYVTALAFFTVRSLPHKSQPPDCRPDPMALPQPPTMSTGSPKVATMVLPDIESAGNNGVRKTGLTLDFVPSFTTLKKKKTQGALLAWSVAVSLTPPNSHAGVAQRRVFNRQALVLRPRA